MRDILVFVIIFGLVPFCLARPWIGILVFAWISYMNPHRFTWGPAYDFPFAKIIAIVTIVGFFFTKDRMPLPKNRGTVLIILLGLYFTFTSFYAMNPEAAWFQWEKVTKILIMTLFTMMLINDRSKLKYFIMVIAFSIGILGVKGGVFSLATGGGFRVYGPAGSFLADNNDIAHALCMILPVLFYLAKDEDSRRLKTILTVTFVMSIISVIFTYSRGGFLALAAVMAFLLFKSKRKVFASVLIIIAIVIGMSYIPGKWMDRIETIQTYEDDRSAMGRVNAWWTAYNLAKDRPLTGGGFETFRWEAFRRYAPDPGNVHDVHSIYFEVMGEHGFVAFGMFLALMLFAFTDTRELKKAAEDNDKLKWAGNYSDMLQGSLVAYMVGGFFLGRAYFDLFYHLVAMVMITKVLAMRELSNAEVVNTKIQTGIDHPELDNRNQK